MYFEFIITVSIETIDVFIITRVYLFDVLKLRLSCPNPDSEFLDSAFLCFYAKQRTRNVIRGPDNL